MSIPQKNTVRPSIRRSTTTNVPQNATNPEQKDYIWYLKKVCGGQDKYEFDTHDEAYKFGWTLREKYGDKIRVDITVETVRVFAV